MNPTNEQELDKLTKEMAHTLSQKYFQNITRVYMENDMSDYTLREYEKKQNKAEVTAELCGDLMDRLILHRFDYIVRNAVRVRTDAEIAKVLDRLEKDFTRGIEKGRTVSFLATLRAERAKLKEVK